MNNSPDPIKGPDPIETPRAEIEREIARLIEPGLRANAWRRDFAAFRERRMWEEQYHERRIRMLRRAIPGLARRPILDLGCGRGGLVVALQRKGYQVIGLDLRRSACRVTRLRGQRYGLNLPLAQGRGEHLPFKSRAFGAVICREVLEHCEDPERVLREIWRVLRRGGACYVTVINRYCWVDPHFHLFALSFLPRALAERYIAWRGRQKASHGDRQRLSEMHYFRYAEFLAQTRGTGFHVCDLGATRLRRSTGLVAWLRRLIVAALRPLSLHASHFEFLAWKPR